MVLKIIDCGSGISFSLHNSSNWCFAPLNSSSVIRVGMALLFEFAFVSSLEFSFEVGFLNCNLAPK